jgi:hypothetical protein
MSDTTSKEKEENEFEIAVAMLQELIDERVRLLMERHYDGVTQEHQLTSRIAESIEQLLNTGVIGPYNIDVKAQELSDRGPSSMEKEVGADLYISVVVDRGFEDEPISKGILIRAKWDHATKKADERRRLQDQSLDMLARSPSSFVWSFGPQGIEVSSAALRSGSAARVSAPRSVGGLIGASILCTEGDPNLGRDITLPVTQSLNRKLEELSIPTALSFVVTKFE